MCRFPFRGRLIERRSFFIGDLLIGRLFIG